MSYKSNASLYNDHVYWSQPVTGVSQPNFDCHEVDSSRKTDSKHNNDKTLARSSEYSDESNEQIQKRFRATEVNLNNGEIEVSNSKESVSNRRNRNQTSSRVTKPKRLAGMLEESGKVIEKVKSFGIDVNEGQHKNDNNEIVKESMKASNSSNSNEIIEKHDFVSENTIDKTESITHQPVSEPFDKQLSVVSSASNQTDTVNENMMLRRTLLQSQTIINSLTEYVLSSESGSYNGSLIWRIDNVKEKILESTSGHQTSFSSPAFYTSLNGYKMCAGIYLNGYGSGRGTHLSVCLTILNGDSNWPFIKTITFILFDKNSNVSKENFVKCFEPDSMAISFQRSASGMNMVLAMPLFCSLKRLNSKEHLYVKDDMMILGVFVDCSR